MQGRGERHGRPVTGLGEGPMGWGKGRLPGVRFDRFFAGNPMGLALGSILATLGTSGKDEPMGGRAVTDLKCPGGDFQLITGIRPSRPGERTFSAAAASAGPAGGVINKIPRI